MAIPTSAFVSADSIFAGLSVIVAKPTTARMSGVTAATDTITTLTAHGLAVGDQVAFVSGTGFTGLTAGALYYVIAAGTATTFQVSATASGSAISPGTSSDGVFDLALVFEALQLDTQVSQSEYEFKRPDSAGVNRVVRNVLTDQQEAFVFNTDQAKRLPKLFGGALVGRRTILCTLYVPDPDDASGYVALKSEADFSATLITEGNVTFGNRQGTIPNLRIKSNKQGGLTWTRDATV